MTSHNRTGYVCGQFQVRIQTGGTGGPDPPWKITSYMGFYREEQIGLPPLEKVGPLLENVGPPLEP